MSYFNTILPVLPEQTGFFNPYQARRTLSSRLKKSGIGVAIAIIGLMAWQSHAHHSISGQFDVNTKLILQGTVAKVSWVNPHIYVHFDVQAKDGTATRWRLGTVPVAMARKAGISKRSLHAEGQVLKITVYPARDGTKHLGFLNRIEYPDGNVVEVAPDRL